MSDSPPPRPPLWLWPTLANLGAPAVACAWLAGVGAVYRLYVPGGYFVLLALASWTVYTLDGLLDGLEAGGSADSTSPRAAFHRRHRVLLLLLALAATGAGTSMALLGATASLVLAAAGLALLVLLYLLHAQALRRLEWTVLPKEVWGGFLFACGVMLPLLDLQGRFAFADASALTAAWQHGPSTFLPWLGWFMLGVMGTLLSDPATPILTFLFVINCLLTALHEGDGRKAIDPASALRLAPALARAAPMMAAALALTSMVLAHILAKPTARPLAFMAGLSAGLMLAVHLLRRRDILSGPAAAVLFDAALLAPIGLVPAVAAG